MDHYIYVIAHSPNGPVKIGHSGDPAKRLRQLQTGHCEKLVVYHAMKIEKEDARRVEKQIHTNILYKRISGEWFNLNVEDAIFECRFGVISA